MPRRRRTSQLRSRKRFSLQAFIPVGVLLIVFGLTLWLLWLLVRMLFAGEATQNQSAKLTIYNGRVEAQLANTEVWAASFTDQTFFEGESLKTGPNSRAALDFFETTSVILDGNSELQILELEQRSSGKKQVLLDLKSGQAWLKVSPDTFGLDTGSTFKIQGSRSQIQVNGTTFNVRVSGVQDTIHLVKGEVLVDIFEPESDNTNQLDLQVGQKLVVTNATYQQIENNRDVKEILGSDFTESDWHLQNLEIFFPQEAAEIRRKIEREATINKPEPTPDAAGTTVNLPQGDLAAPEILSPAPAQRLSADEDAVKVEGTAPLEAFQISVNGYTLSKFNPGDRKWTYFAAKKFGTLKPGENIYEVIAISRDGKRSAPASVTVFYEAEPEPETASEDPRSDNGEVIQGNSVDFTAPKVTSPAIFQVSQTEFYQTSASVVTFSGTVDPKTNAVEVNGFRLKKFKPGDTKFSYIANANYGNMKEGENSYVITAFGPDGKQSSTTIRIVYTPLSVRE